MVNYIFSQSDERNGILLCSIIINFLEMAGSNKSYNSISTPEKVGINTPPLSVIRVEWVGENPVCLCHVAGAQSCTLGCCVVKDKLRGWWLHHTAHPTAFTPQQNTSDVPAAEQPVTVLSTQRRNSAQVSMDKAHQAGRDHHTGEKAAEENLPYVWRPPSMCLGHRLKHILSNLSFIIDTWHCAAWYSTK